MEPENQVQSLYEKYLQYLDMICFDTRQYQDFLQLAGQLYKHVFQSQVMIFGQRKDAAYIADEKLWNRIGRTVKPDATAIAVLAQKNGIPVIKNVYELSDTTGENVDEILGKKRFDLSAILLKFVKRVVTTEETAFQAIWNRCEQHIWRNYPDISALESNFLADSAAFAICSRLQITDPELPPINPKYIGPNGVKDIGGILNEVICTELDHYEHVIAEIRREQKHEIQNRKRKASTNPQSNSRNRQGLSAWAAWDDHPQEYDGESQLTLLGFGNGRNPDEESTGTGNNASEQESRSHGTQRLHAGFHCQPCASCTHFHSVI